MLKNKAHDFPRFRDFLHTLWVLVYLYVGFLLVLWVLLTDNSAFKFHTMVIFGLARPSIIYPLVNVYIAMENHHFSWENPL